ncbi:MAG: metal ABC transporter permease [Ruminococcus sp.]|nr:metal ABC transporter permease [Ruminococcus sp.]
MLEKIAYYFEFPIVRYALTVALLVALCASLLGVTLVLKRFSFIGDGLSHVAFGATAVATVTGITNQMIIVIPLTVLSAVLLLRTGQNTKIKGDAVIAMISVGALAVGYMLINMFSQSANIAGDVCSTLFGSTSILTLDKSDVMLCMGLSAVVLCVFVLFYNKIFAVTFDENFSKATGINSEIYNLIIAIITALIIVLAMKLVGSLIISALIIFPAITAMRIFRSFKSVILCSAVISVVCSGTGFFISLLFGTPVGATIVTANIVVFFIFSLISSFSGQKK